MATTGNKGVAREFYSPERWASVRVDPPPFKTLAETKVSYGTLTLRLGDRPYHLGETVTGEVVLDYRSEVTARSIIVKLIAMEYLETGSGKRRRIQTRDVLIGGRQHDPSRHGIVSVLYQQDTQGKLLLGHHTWQFELPIPTTAFPSFSTSGYNRMCLVYHVKAYVDIPMWPDTEAETSIEVRHSPEQHRQILAGLPGELTSIPGFTPRALPLGPRPNEVDARPWNICACSNASVHVCLTSPAPVIIPFRSGVHSINAELEITPSTADVRRIVVELKKLQYRGASTTIQRKEIPYHHSSLVDISMDVCVNDEHMSFINYYPYARATTQDLRTWSTHINTFSFDTHWFHFHYILVVKVEMGGFTVGSPTLRAEIPVVHPEALELPKAEASAPPPEVLYVQAVEVVKS